MNDPSEDRRTCRDRRDWDLFVYPERRKGGDRRSGGDRRESNKTYDGPERRATGTATASPLPQSAPADKAALKQNEYYTTAEVAEMTGLSQTTLLLWVRNKIIDGSRIKRSLEGRRLWTAEDVKRIEEVKSRNGWTG
jgi:hypothetical protein